MRNLELQERLQALPADAMIIVSELARLEKIGWGNGKTDTTISPYVIIEAINLLINSQPKKTRTDYTQTGEMACAMIDQILKSNATGGRRSFRPLDPIVGKEET